LPRVEDQKVQEQKKVPEETSGAPGKRIKRQRQGIDRKLTHRSDKNGEEKRRGPDRDTACQCQGMGGELNGREKKGRAGGYEGKKGVKRSEMFYQRGEARGGKSEQRSREKSARILPVHTE